MSTATLLCAGANPNTLLYEKTSILEQTVRYHMTMQTHQYLIRMLQFGASVNKYAGIALQSVLNGCDRNMVTTTIDYDLVKLLIDYNANMHMHFQNGCADSTIALQRKIPEDQVIKTMRLMINNNADINQYNKQEYR